MMLRCYLAGQSVKALSESERGARKQLTEQPVGVIQPLQTGDSGVDGDSLMLAATTTSLPRPETYQPVTCLCVSDIEKGVK